MLVRQKRYVRAKNNETAGLQNLERQDETTNNVLMEKYHYDSRYCGR